MAGDKIEPVAVGFLPQRRGQPFTQAQHAQPDLFKLGLPIGAQGVVG